MHWDQHDTCTALAGGEGELLPSHQVSGTVNFGACLFCTTLWTTFIFKKEKERIPLSPSPTVYRANHSAWCNWSFTSLPLSSFFSHPSLPSSSRWEMKRGAAKQTRTVLRWTGGRRSVEPLAARAARTSKTNNKKVTVLPTQEPQVGWLSAWRVQILHLCGLFLSSSPLNCSIPPQKSSATHMLLLLQHHHLSLSNTSVQNSTGPASSKLLERAMYLICSLQKQTCFVSGYSDISVSYTHPFLKGRLLILQMNFGWTCSTHMGKALITNEQRKVTQNTTHRENLGFSSKTCTFQSRHF